MPWRSCSSPTLAAAFSAHEHRNARGGQMPCPLARTVIGGLITSMVLTLVSLPFVYTLVDGAAAWLTCV